MAAARIVVRFKIDPILHSTHIRRVAPHQYWRNERSSLRTQSLRGGLITRPISSEYLPAVARPSFWRALKPKVPQSGFEPRTQLTSIEQRKWNPATFFIIIFILIGSQAIQIIALQKDYDLFSQETEAKLATLREVVRRIQNGEDVDVEGMLGTGDKVKEKEWEEVIRELEEEDAVIQSRRKRRKAKEIQEDNQEVTPVEEPQSPTTK